MTWEERWHPLREEWVVVSDHRDHRPWLGERVAEVHSPPSLTMNNEDKQVHMLETGPLATFSEATSLRDVPGVYTVWMGLQLVYVGMAVRRDRQEERTGINLIFLQQPSRTGAVSLERLARHDTPLWSRARD